MRHKSTVVQLYKMGNKQPICAKAAQIITDQVNRIRELEGYVDEMYFKFEELRKVDGELYLSIQEKFEES